MEKFSRFRDDATGIQVFLTPVPPSSTVPPVIYLVLPLVWLLGLVRLLLLAIVVVPLWTLSRALAGPVGPGARSALDAFFGRTTLALLGFFSIAEEVVSLRHKGRASASRHTDPFEPKPKDVVVCNFSSWIDALYLAVRLRDPVFASPVVSPPPPTSAASAVSASASSPASSRRRQQTLSAATTARGDVGVGEGEEPQRLLGWRAVSWWHVARRAGFAPQFAESEGAQGRGGGGGFVDLETIVKGARGPVVIFPELVTSNNRGLLRIASPLFPEPWREAYRETGTLRLGTRHGQLHVVTIKHAPPTLMWPSTTYTVPRSRSSSNSPSRSVPLPEPVSHALSLLFALPPALGGVGFGGGTASCCAPQLSVRMLTPRESISYEAAGQGGAASAGRSTTTTGDLTRLEAGPEEWVAETMSALGRLRRTGLGWTHKPAFLELCGVVSGDDAGRGSSSRHPSASSSSSASAARKAAAASRSKSRR